MNDEMNSEDLYFKEKEKTRWGGGFFHDDDDVSDLILAEGRLMRADYVLLC